MTTSTLRSLLRELDTFRQRVPLDELTRIMREHLVTAEDVAEFVEFGDKHYRRNLMHEGPAYQALVLCWRAGQRSPIHDHRGSSCGVRVLEGVATETLFERGPDGMLRMLDSKELAAGRVCGSQDADIHQVSNLAADRSALITLHIYSPPLLRMGTYSLDDAEIRVFEDPVHSAHHEAEV